MSRLEINSRRFFSCERSRLTDLIFLQSLELLCDDLHRPTTLFCQHRLQDVFQDVVHPKANFGIDVRPIHFHRTHRIIFALLKLHFALSTVNKIKCCHKTKLRSKRPNNTFQI